MTDGEHSVPVSAGRDRIVLAMLLLHSGRVVSVGMLAEAVWGVDPPTTARGQLQTCVSHLRRLLPRDAIGSDPAGYRIDVREDELDALRFAALAARARAEGDADLFRTALDLWRGDALEGLESHAIRLAATALDEQRAAVLEDWVELELGAGRERDLIGELASQVERFPLRERLRGQLMVAFYRCGRQADALAEFRRAREILADELGLEPGRELQELHASILAGSLPPAGRYAAPALAPVRCLPRTVGDFTGRAAVVERLVGAISVADATAPVLAVIDGMAGSGKTTLALHLAALVGDRYPDAHLFVDLHGHSERRPLDPAAALLVLLRQLGVGAERIPDTLVDRVGLWRTELASRRALVLIDNAASSAQVADLLPTAPGSLGLVTGRRRLAGLDGVHPESLPVLAEAEGVALLERIVGERVRDEPSASAEVVRRCGGLPLAIRLAGARLAHRPRWQVADLLRRLGESALPELAAEDRTVADAFAVSYGHLPEPARRMFRLLGAYPGSDFDAIAVAALTGLPLDEAQDLLDDLVDVHLVEEPEPGVFRLHDLLREYAGTIAGELPADERLEALRGVLDLQLHAALNTVSLAYRAVINRAVRADEPLRPDLLAAIADPDARLERERRNLRSYCEAAVGAGLAGYAWRIPPAAWRHLWVRSYIDDVESLQRFAIEVAEQIGDRSAIATNMNYLGSALLRSARLEETGRLLLRIIEIREELGERSAVASAMSNLAGTHQAAGRWLECIRYTREATRLSSVSRRGGVNPTVGLNNIAMASYHLGRYDDSLHYHRLRLLWVTQFRDRQQTADCLMNIAAVKYWAGRCGAQPTIRQIKAAMGLCRRVGDTYILAGSHNELARVLAAENRYPEAIENHLRAIVLAGEDTLQRSKYKVDLGNTRLLAGDRACAAELAEEVLAGDRIGELPHRRACAQALLAECVVTSDPARARELWRSAHDTFEQLGTPERHQVAARLAAFEGGVDQLRPAAERGTMVW